MIARFVVAVAMVCAVPVLAVPVPGAVASPAKVGAKAEPPWPAVTASRRSAVLGTRSFRDMVLDADRQRIVVAQAQGPLFLTDLEGNRVQEVDAAANAEALATPQPGGTVYAARPSAHAITSLDPTTTVTRTYDVGTGVCPVDVAVSEGMVWFVDACGDQTPRLRGLSPDTGEVTPAGDAVPTGAVIAASPRAAGTLFVLETSRPPGERVELAAYDVHAGATPSLTRRATTRLRARAASGLDVTPDGSAVVVATTARVARFRTSDLARQGSYGTGDGEPDGWWTGAVAIADGGTLAAVGSAQDVSFFDLRYREAHTFDNNGATWWAGAPRVAEVGAGRVFTVAARTGGTEASLHSFELPEPPGAGPPPALTRVSDVEVDEPHGRVLISQQGGPLAITDLRGTLRSVRDLGYLTSTTRSATGSELYGALPDDSAILVMDLRTLSVRRVELPQDVCPVSVAVARARLWISDGCAPASAALHALDLSNGSLERGLGRGGSRLLSDPSQPGVLVACSVDVTGSHPEQFRLVVYDVAGRGGPAPRARASTPSWCGESVQLRRDGRPGLLMGTEEYSLGLARGRTYIQGLYPRGATAVGQRADGLVVVGNRLADGDARAYTNQNLFVVRPGRPRPVSSARLTRARSFLSHVGVVRFGARRAYAVALDEHGQPRLYALEPDRLRAPLRYPTRMTLCAPRSESDSRRIAATVRLDVRGRGAVVIFQRLPQRPGGPVTELARTRVDKRGIARFRFRYPTRSLMVLRAVYRGGAGNHPEDATTVIYAAPD